MTKRKRKRDKNGHFLPRGQTPREKPRPDTPPSGNKSAEREEHGQMSVSQTTTPGSGRQPTTDPERPTCWGNCYELSSACNACRSYNACRRASS